MNLTALVSALALASAALVSPAYSQEETKAEILDRLRVEFIAGRTEISAEDTQRLTPNDVRDLHEYRLAQATERQQANNSGSASEAQQRLRARPPVVYSNDVYMPAVEATQAAEDRAIQEEADRPHSSLEKTSLYMKEHPAIVFISLLGFLFIFALIFRARPSRAQPSQ